MLFIFSPPKRRINSSSSELRNTRVTLPSGTTTELVVDATSFVAFGSDNHETTYLSDTLAQFDVSTTTRHVGSDGDSTLLTGISNDLRFPLVILGIQNLMFDTLTLQKRA
jgi:hypothetical protein